MAKTPSPTSGAFYCWCIVNLIYGCYIWVRRLAVQAETLEQMIEVLKSLKLATAKGELDVLLTQAGELNKK